MLGAWATFFNKSSLDMLFNLGYVKYVCREIRSTTLKSCELSHKLGSMQSPQSLSATWSQQLSYFISAVNNWKTLLVSQFNAFSAVYKDVKTWHVQRWLKEAYKLLNIVFILIGHFLGDQCFSVISVPAHFSLWHTRYISVWFFDTFFFC